MTFWGQCRASASQPPPHVRGVDLRVGARTFRRWVGDPAWGGGRDFKTAQETSRVLKNRSFWGKNRPFWAKIDHFGQNFREHYVFSENFELGWRGGSTSEPAEAMLLNKRFLIASNPVVLNLELFS